MVICITICHSMVSLVKKMWVALYSRTLIIRTHGTWVNSPDNRKYEYNNVNIVNKENKSQLWISSYLHSCTVCMYCVFTNTKVTVSSVHVWNRLKYCFKHTYGRINELFIRFNFWRSHLINIHEKNRTRETNLDNWGLDNQGPTAWVTCTTFFQLG